MKGGLRLHAARDVNGRQFLQLRFRAGGQLCTFACEVGPFGIGLRADRDIFARRHGHCARHQTRNAGNEDRRSRRTRSRDTHDEAGGGDNAVIGTKHGSTQPADPCDEMGFAMRPHDLPPMLADHCPHRVSA